MIYKPVDERGEILPLYMGALGLLLSTVLVEEEHKHASDMAILRVMRQITKQSRIEEQ